MEYKWLVEAAMGAAVAESLACACGGDRCPKCERVQAWVDRAAKALDASQRLPVHMRWWTS